MRSPGDELFSWKTKCVVDNIRLPVKQAVERHFAINFPPEPSHVGIPEYGQYVDINLCLFTCHKHTLDYH